jgi:hypothetical protein
MLPEEIPAELTAIIVRRKRAGEQIDISPSALAEIITAWDAYRGPLICGKCTWGSRFIQVGHRCRVHDNCRDR